MMSKNNKFLVEEQKSDCSKNSLSGGSGKMCVCIFFHFFFVFFMFNCDSSVISTEYKAKLNWKLSRGKRNTRKLLFFFLILWNTNDVYLKYKYCRVSLVSMHLLIKNSLSDLCVWIDAKKIIRKWRKTDKKLQQNFRFCWNADLCVFVNRFCAVLERNVDLLVCVLLRCVSDIPKKF